MKGSILACCEGYTTQTTIRQSVPMASIGKQICGNGIPPTGTLPQPRSNTRIYIPLNLSNYVWSLMADKGNIPQHQYHNVQSTSNPRDTTMARSTVRMGLPGRHDRTTPHDNSFFFFFRWRSLRQFVIYCPPRLQLRNTHQGNCVKENTRCKLFFFIFGTFLFTQRTTAFLVSVLTTYSKTNKRRRVHHADGGLPTCC